MTTIERDRLIVVELGFEYLGSGINSISYRDPITADRYTVDMANFFFLIWDKAKEKDWWDEFWDFVYEKAADEYLKATDNRFPLHPGYFWQVYFAGLLHPGKSLIDPGCFADTLAEFLRQRAKESKPSKAADDFIAAAKTVMGKGEKGK